MAKLISKEILPEFYGMNNVIKETYDDNTVCYYTQNIPFEIETAYTKACKLNITEDLWGNWMYLFDANNNVVGKYYMEKRLLGCKAKQLVEQRSKLFFYKVFDDGRKVWKSIVSGTPAKLIESYKVGCGIKTILLKGKWYAVDFNGKRIVAPGKYDYIDGFNHNLARVKYNASADLNDPAESTKERWGIIDIKGNEVLPVIYDEIWSFYGKNRKLTKVVQVEEKIDGDGHPYTLKTIYEFWFHSRNLVEVGYWINDDYYEVPDDIDYSEQYSVWDALDGEIEAAGNIDWEG